VNSLNMFVKSIVKSRKINTLYDELKLKLPDNISTHISGDTISIRKNKSINAGIEYNGDNFTITFIGVPWDKTVFKCNTLEIIEKINSFILKDNHEVRMYTNKTKLSEILQLGFPVIGVKVNEKSLGNNVDEIFIEPNKPSLVTIYALINNNEAIFRYYITHLEQEDAPDSEVIKIIEKHGMLIGSRRWGGATEYSDYDYAFPYYDMKELMKYISDEDLQIGMYPENRMQNIFSFHITLDNKVFNLIVYFYMSIVKYLNAEMDKRLLDDDFKEKMKDKDFRIQQCESIINDNKNNIDDFFN